MNASIAAGQTWPDFSRTRRAIAVVDVVESVRLLQADETDAIDRWRRFVNEVRAEVLPGCGGRLVKSLGDGMLVECASVPPLVAMGFDLQRRIARYNDDAHADRRMLLRIGLHAGDVVADELDIYGTGVNLAARVAGVARPGGLAATEDVVDELLPGVDALFEDAGLCYLKHIEAPVQVYHLRPCDDAAMPVTPAPVVVEDKALETCIALVPFVGAEGDVEQRTVADLLGDMLLTRLSTVPQLRVISRLSSEQFRTRGLEGPRIAAVAGATYLVAGRLHGRGTRCRLFVELVEAASAQVVWSTAAPLDSTELFHADEGFTPGLVQQIVDQVVAHQLRHVAMSPLPTLASQTLHFAAIHLMHRRATADFERASSLLGQLLDRHPRAAAPHAWMAQWHVLRVTKGVGGASEAEAGRALDHTRRALDLNPDSAMALAMEAFVHCHLLRDLAGARERVDRALDANPSEPWGWLVRATVESLLGEGERAWAAARRAALLSPMDPLKHYFDSLSASAAVAAERFGEAESLAQLALSKDPRHLPTLRALVIAQVHVGRVDEARATAARVLQLQPDFTLARYVGEAPRGGEAMRTRWAQALREAGVPD